MVSWCELAASTCKSPDTPTATLLLFVLDFLSPAAHSTGILDVTAGKEPPAAWIFSNMKLVAVIGGAISAAAIAAMVGLSLVDCCMDRSHSSKVAAAQPIMG